MRKGCWEKRKKVEKAHQSQQHTTFVAGPLSKTHHMATSINRCKGPGQGCLAACLRRQRQHRFWETLEALATPVFKDNAKNYVRQRRASPSISLAKCSYCYY